MSKYLLSAAAAAFLMVGSSAAWAADGDTCEPSFSLPNSNWSGTEQTTVTVDLDSWDTSAGNAWVMVTTTSYCVATNKGGNLVEAQGSEAMGSSDPTKIKVCQNVGGGGPHTVTAEGELYGFTQDDCNP